MPEIAGIMESYRGAGAKFVRMSGSGSTVFAAFESMAEAEEAASAVPGSIVTRSLGQTL